MREHFTPLNTILLLGAAQGFVLGVILTFKKKGNQQANRILAGILYFLSFAIVFHTLSHAQILPFLKIHTLIIGIASIMIGPLLFFYVKALTSVEFKLKRSDFFHFIPFLICVLLGFFYLFAGFGTDKHLFIKIITIVSFGLYTIYIIFANIRLVSYFKTIKNNFSNIEKINLIWLRVFILLLTLFLIFAAIYDLFFKTKNWDLIWLVSCIIIYCIRKPMVIP